MRGFRCAAQVDPQAQPASSNLAQPGERLSNPDPHSQETTSQAVIDSKCKELTVLPLADISEAHDVAPRKEEVVVEKAEDKEAPSLVRTISVTCCSWLTAFPSLSRLPKSPISALPHLLLQWWKRPLSLPLR